jgi:hypothetical protein
VCGTRRARAWRRAFRAAGIEAVVVETDTDDAPGGAYQVGVPERQLLRANEIITQVQSGERRLPGAPIGWQAIVALLAILALLAWTIAA